MNILYLSVHEVLEFDEIKLFTEMGHNVFSIGMYQNSNRGNLRGPVPNLYQDEHLKVLALQSSKEHIHPRLIEWMDVCIQMHTYPVNSPPFLPWLMNNWPNFNGKRTIWRSIGQSTPHIEEELTTYRSRGLEIVRYSPKERTIANYAGEDAVIRFYKDPEEYCGWTGEKKILINFTQSFKRRRDHCGYDAFLRVSEGLEAKVYGGGNEDLGDLWGGQVPHEEQKRILRECRVYFYHGTAPASYTLGLVEAMMTGIPVVAAGREFTKNLHPGQETNEIEDIIKNGQNGFVSNSTGQLRQYVKELLENDQRAKEVGHAGRQTAIELFGKQTITSQWEEYLNG